MCVTYSVGVYVKTECDLALGRVPICRLVSNYSWRGFSPGTVDSMFGGSMPVHLLERAVLPSDRQVAVPCMHVSERATQEEQFISIFWIVLFRVKQRKERKT